jgi:hypothetical protein
MCALIVECLKALYDSFFEAPVKGKIICEGVYAIKD